MPGKRKREDEEDEAAEEEEEDTQDEEDSDHDADDDGMKRTVVVGNLEGKMELIYQDVLKTQFPGAKEIKVDWKTRTALVEFGSVEKAATASSDYNGTMLFGEKVACGVSSGATCELCFSNIAQRTTVDDIRALVPKDSGLLSVKLVESADKVIKRVYARFADRSGALESQQV
eukprot:TRINITY_DN2189_c1_g1_i2.p1 TRINITY_DN2189_c1_g1~~TRINITY_DN2189_c1_g1_i2.p1  ORF type:complete len:191 (+),score=64.02 TRINITY_DN2189_c1_g1_i2:56-574(+)